MVNFMSLWLSLFKNVGNGFHLTNFKAEMYYRIWGHLETGLIENDLEIGHQQQTFTLLTGKLQGRIWCNLEMYPLQNHLALKELIS
jgi:hypothetical protein